MDKQEIKNILLSMQTHENNEIINILLGKLDVLDEESLQKAAEQVGGTPEAVKKFFEAKIAEKQNSHQEKHQPINEMFSYGTAGNCIHLHLPVDLHEMISEKGFSKTIATVNLHLLDAIDRITKLKNDGFYKFQDKDCIYMISPALLGKELRFLNGLDFKTHSYNKKQLSDDEFIKDNPEAMLGTSIFGKGINLGTAKIDFDTILSEDWQNKKRETIQEFENKGITLQDKKVKDDEQK